MYSHFTRRMLNRVAGFDFVAAHFSCESNRFSTWNPGGFVNFGSAQNFLNSREIQQRMTVVEWSEQDAHYQPFSGTASCKVAIADHLESLAGVHVDPQHVIVGNGVISLLEALAIAILNHNENVLVPTPVFPGFPSLVAHDSARKPEPDGQFLEISVRPRLLNASK